MPAEAPLRETKFGLAPDGDGWFVVNARAARWRDGGAFGKYCDFEGKRPFPEFGINLSVLAPGQRLSLYHHERAQEGFLVLAGECVLVVEGEERALAAWDFFHCPGGTAHTIVGAGDRPAVVVAVGARGGRKELVYPAEGAAARYDAAASRDTTDASEAYARFPRSQRTSYEDGWLPDW